MGGPAYINNIAYYQFDNFYQVTFIDNHGIEHKSAEHYYQYCKCIKDSDKLVILNSSIEDVYSLGQKVEICDLWDSIKLFKMYEGNRFKYLQNSSLGEMLKNTSGKIIVPSGDLFWSYGSDYHQGENWNGLILEAIRDELNGHSVDDFRLEMKVRSLRF